MWKPFSVIFFILCMVWLGSIVVTTDSQARLERACGPTALVDKAATAVGELVDSSWGDATHQFFVKHIEYGCSYIVWRMFYQDDWQRASADSQALALRRQQTSGRP